jgi:alpha-L-rhamnosidase
MPRPWNEYAYFRRSVRLTGRVRRAVVRVSADARYTLLVNGRRAHQGPARSFPERQSYDTLDLAPYLEPGENAICATVHQFGVPAFLSQYRGASGFLLDGVIETEGRAVELHTPGGWLSRPARGWRKDVARLSVQLGFHEQFDADADPAGWMLPDFEAKAEDGWIEPVAVGPVGCHPWLAMEPRGVPLLADHVENFTAVTAQFRGENGRGYKITPDVYRFVLTEQRKKERNLLEKAQEMLADDAEATTIAPATDSDFIAAVLDLGTYRTGHMILDITEAVGDEIIDVIFSEDVDKSGWPLLRGTAEEPTYSEVATALRYRCRPGSQRWESFQYLGFRYATLVFRNIEPGKPLKVRHVAVRQVHAALEEAGSFQCSDERLNQIWQVARNTQLNCAFDALVDCPWREQAQWWGDARVQSQVMAYAYGDVSLLERGIRQVAQSQAADGSLHAHPPSDAPGHRLPDFMLTWIGSVWDHYWLTGRTDLLRECLPVVERVLAFFKRHEWANRLVGGFDGFWVFLDWAPVRKADFSATLNLMYLQALRWAARLREVAGDARGAERHHATAEALAGSIDTHFWDAAANVWRDGFDPESNAPVEEVSQHANALAILLDLRPEAGAKIARDVLLKPAQARRSRAVTGSPFFYAYVLEAMAKAGLRAEAIDVIREKWGSMLDRGATTFWEHWEPSDSLCHAWSASPLYHLSQLALGVAATEPGWRRVRIAPVVGKLESAKGVVPTPLGPLRIEWEKGGEDQLAVRVEVPEGMEAEFVSPAADRRALGPGVHEFHT